MSLLPSQRLYGYGAARVRLSPVLNRHAPETGDVPWAATGLALGLLASLSFATWSMLAHEAEDAVQLVLVTPAPPVLIDIEPPVIPDPPSTPLSPAVEQMLPKPQAPVVIAEPKLPAARKISIPVAAKPTPSPVAKPAVAMAALATAAVAKPAPARRPEPVRARPRPAAPAFPVSLATAAIDPAPVEVARRASKPAQRSRARVVPAVAAISAAMAANPIEPTPVGARSGFANDRHRDTRRGRPAPAIAVPGVARLSQPAARPAENRIQERGRPQLPVASQERRATSEAEPLLSGVALASLASCVSDRHEDVLKQRVIAAVGGRSGCASAAGRYRFIETKNLNAFLLSIERAASRPAADRCTELSLALECLEQRG